MSDRHDWNSWENYQDVHDRRIRDFTGHFILDDQLSATQTATDVRWAGILYCRDGIEIHVQKLQEVQHLSGRPYVRTLLYSYHVQQRVGARVVNIFRYDNAHPHPEHPTPHHRHQYDEQGNEAASAKHVGVEGWPTLSDVIEEAHAWWLSIEGQRPPVIG